jgi:hypothetical protein
LLFSSIFQEAIRFIEEKKKAKDKEQSSQEQTAFEREDFLEDEESVIVEPGEKEYEEE